MIELLLLFGIGWLIFSRVSGGDRLGREKTPQQHIAFLVRYMRQHAITPAQLGEAWDSVPDLAPAPKSPIGAMVLFVLGGVLVFAGVGVYTSMFWEVMSPAMRVLVTLGVGFALSVFSVVAMKEGKYKQAILPLILLAAAFECCGWFVLLHELFPSSQNMYKATLFCFSVMALQQGAVFYTFRRDALALTAILFAYGALQSALALAGVGDKYAALLLGGSMVATASALQRTPQERISSLLFLLGGMWFNGGIFLMLADVTHASMASLVTGMSLISGGYAMRLERQPGLSALGFLVGSLVFYMGLFDEVRHTPLEVLFLGVAVAMMYVAARVQSSPLLVTSTLAILSFIGYYTWEYFMNSAGWPIALIIMGTALLGVGSAALKLKRKYGTQKR